MISVWRIDILDPHQRRTAVQLAAETRRTAASGGPTHVVLSAMNRCITHEGITGLAADSAPVT